MFILTMFTDVGIKFYHINIMHNLFFYTFADYTTIKGI